MAKYYDPNEVTVSFAGVPLQGYADGSFVTVSYDSDLFGDVVGTDGEVTRSKSNDLRATVTVRLMQSSDSNDLLSAIMQADIRGSNGAGVGVLFIRDEQGRSVYSASNAWILRVPDSEFDRTPTQREWSFRCARLESFIGGN